MSLILGIDTSCDETSAAVVANGTHILSNIVSSQVKLHAPHGGVVPELASRSHLEALPLVVRKALDEAHVALRDLTGIAVTSSPGLIGCLLVGLSYAKSLAYALKIPFTAVHHLTAHLFSPFLEHPPIFPCINLVVSGGHTALYHVKDFDRIECLGQTVDDAAGEAYDKTAKLLGVGYPGGPVIDRLAREGNPEAFSFTRARVKKGPYYFSFSGLKTAVALLVRAHQGTGDAEGGSRSSRSRAPSRRGRERETRRRQDPFPLDNQLVRDIAASFQREAVGALIEKVEQALDSYPAKVVLVSGGVACNSLLREKIRELALRRGIDYFIPSPLLCTDNGAMIAYVGARQIDHGLHSPLEANAYPSAPM
ncbi:MAG: tRNA (adenosine(37)-N6)-threonylcarbamoyltransferase complex transferase subunit TsaD [Deltaproteobacteria bacterium]|nr:tRNA (adenosine(37)-N6)-threonylcarbamoyltransferase complex transferase subunit TsaD [Deltaproteobacteria bacterium]